MLIAGIRPYAVFHDGLLEALNWIDQEQAKRPRLDLVVRTPDGLPHTFVVIDRHDEDRLIEAEACHRDVPQAMAEERTDQVVEEYPSLVRAPRVDAVAQAIRELLTKEEQ